MQHEEAVRRQARAPSAEHGDRQEGDHRRRLWHRRAAGQEPDPADHVVVQRQHPPTIRTTRRPPRNCWPTPAIPTGSTPIYGRCRCSAPTTRMLSRIAELMQSDLHERSASAPRSSATNGANIASGCRLGSTRWRNWAGPGIMVIPDNFFTPLASCDCGADRVAAAPPNGATRTSTPYWPRR